MAAMPQRVTYQQVSDDSKSFTERSGTVWSRAYERVDQLKAPKFWVIPDHDPEHPVIVGTPGESFPGLPVQHALFGPETQPATGLVCLSRSTDRDRLRERFYGEFAAAVLPEATPAPVPESAAVAETEPPEAAAPTAAATPAAPAPVMAAESEIVAWRERALPHRVRWHALEDGKWVEQAGTVWARGAEGLHVSDQLWVSADTDPRIPVLIGRPNYYERDFPDVPEGALVRPYGPDRFDVAQRAFVKHLNKVWGPADDPVTGPVEHAPTAFALDGVSVLANDWGNGRRTWDWSRKDPAGDGLATHRVSLNTDSGALHYSLAFPGGASAALPPPPGVDSPAAVDLAVRAMVASGADVLAENAAAVELGFEPSLHLPRHRGRLCVCTGCQEGWSESELLPVPAVERTIAHRIRLEPDANPHQVALEYALPIYVAALNERHAAAAVDLRAGSEQRRRWSDGLEDLVGTHLQRPDRTYFLDYNLALVWRYAPLSKEMRANSEVRNSERIAELLRDVRPGDRGTPRTAPAAAPARTTAPHRRH